MPANVTVEKKTFEREAFSVKELSAKLGLSPSFVRLEIARGRLKALRAGRRIIILRESIATWLKESPSDVAENSR
jgi:excisionase family DNA binding protein